MYCLVVLGPDKRKESGGKVMSGQEEISMKHYVDTCIKAAEDKIKALEKLTEQKDILHNRAIKEARDSMLQRLEGMNQFRDQIKEERLNYVSKDYLASALATIKGTIQKQEVHTSFSAGKVWMVMFLISLIPTILAIIALFR